MTEVERKLRERLASCRCRTANLLTRALLDRNSTSILPKKSAALCALNILGQLKTAGLLLDRLRSIRLGGFVQSAAGFKDQAAIINGASELIVYAFGENGRHARAAIGCSSLPLGAAVEVEATFVAETEND
jgi:enamine deaminase RidA (YjgF/YER057c/UK114 family)